MRARGSWLNLVRFGVLAVASLSTLVIPTQSVAATTPFWAQLVFSVWAGLGAAAVAIGDWRGWKSWQYAGLGALFFPLVIFAVSVLALAGPRGAFAAGVALFAALTCVKIGIDLAKHDAAQKRADQ